jgi:hypothetical protein
MESPVRSAFLSDLTFNGVHSYAADGHLLAWLANLSRLRRVCEGMPIVFPGHGEAAEPQQLISAQSEYLLTLVSHVKALAQGRPALSDAEKSELEQRMTRYLPNAGLPFLIGMSADAIARELAR